MDKRQRVIDLCKELRLPGIRELVEEDTAFGETVAAIELLHTVLTKEKNDRWIRSKSTRIRRANFPEKKLLEEIDTRALPADAQQKLPNLQTLDFIKAGQNVILTGSPGTGKSHLAIGLGVEACLAGYKVYFASVSSLINQLKESRSERTLRSFELRFEKYDLVIIDELGYISFDKEGAELLFTHLSLRAGRSSTIITSNLSFAKWEEVFHDPILTAALTDRLTHKSHVVNMIGPSYRMRETQKWLENSQSEVAQN